MGCEANPGKYNPFKICLNTQRRPAKVFRKKYTKNGDIISALYNKNVLEYLKLDDDCVIDVTDFYSVTTNIRLNVNRNLKDSTVLYICVYSNNKWVPAFADFTKNHQVTFKKMACDMLYLPCQYLNGEFMPIIDPIIVDKKGSITFKSTNENKFENITLYNLLSNVTEMQLLFSKKLKGRSFDSCAADIENNRYRITPKVNQKYELFYWQNRWKFAAETCTKDGKIIFYKIPKNSIYKIQGTDFDNFSRPFIVEKDKIIWL